MWISPLCPEDLKNHNINSSFSCSQLSTLKHTNRKKGRRCSGDFENIPVEIGLSFKEEVSCEFWREDGYEWISSLLKTEYYRREDVIATTMWQKAEVDSKIKGYDGKRKKCWWRSTGCWPFSPATLWFRQVPCGPIPSVTSHNWWLCNRLVPLLLSQGRKEQNYRPLFISLPVPRNFRFPAHAPNRLWIIKLHLVGTWQTPVLVHYHGTRSAYF